MADSTSIDFTKLIPELQRWNNGAGIAVEDWVGCTGNFELAVGYSRLFWPAFMEHDGCVFFADGFSQDSYSDWLKHCKGDRQSVEAVMNHRHVFDYFSHSKGSASSEQIIYLGRTLKDIWATKLVRDFPDRRFLVTFPEGPFEDLIEYQVTFRQAVAEKPSGYVRNQ